MNFIQTHPNFGKVEKYSKENNLVIYLLTMLYEERRLIIAYLDVLG